MTETWLYKAYMAEENLRY